MVQMYLQGKAAKKHLLPSGLNWSINETILTADQATADNLPAPIGSFRRRDGGDINYRLLFSHRQYRHARSPLLIVAP